MEGKIIAHAIERLALADNLSNDAIEHIKRSMALIGEISDGLGFCLSENGDLLSQWRGYANDATGFSIGFSKGYLEWLSSQYKIEPMKSSAFSLLQVRYLEKEHEDEVRPTYTNVKRLIEDGALKVVYKGLLLETRTDKEIERERQEVQKKFNALTFEFIRLLPKLFTLKAEAFSEEREWRLVSPLVVQSKDKCEFRATDCRIIPFRTYDLLESHEAPMPINEVIIGPKNQTPPWAVNDFLMANGFNGVAVRRSSASYR